MSNFDSKEKHKRNQVDYKINDEELEQAAGGLTIIDTCQNRFSEIICFKAIWGRCSQLDYVMVSESEHNYQITREYKMSCKKGVFTNIKYIDSFTSGGSI